MSIETWRKEYVPGKWLTERGIMDIVRSDNDVYPYMSTSKQTFFAPAGLIAPVGVWLEHDGGEFNPLPNAGLTVSIRNGRGEEYGRLRPRLDVRWECVTHFRIEDIGGGTSNAQELPCVMPVVRMTLEQIAEMYSHKKPAHGGMMSAPKQERQRISDQAWEALCKVYPKATAEDGRAEWERDHAECGTVLLTVEEHEALSDRAASWERMYRYGNALRAEVERLTNELAAASGREGAHQQWIKQLEEQLRKGAGDENSNREASKLDSASSHAEVLEAPDTSHAVQDRYTARSLMRANRVCADDSPADPRLGLPQPDGEPVEPMSARKWRWLA